MNFFQYVAEISLESEGSAFATLGTAQQLCPFAPCAICVHLRFSYRKFGSELCKDEITTLADKNVHENDDKYRYYCTLRMPPTPQAGEASVSHLKLTGLPFGPDLSFTLNMPLTPKASAACISLLPSKWQLVHSN